MACKVVYRGGVSYTVAKMKWMKGKPKVVSDAKAERFRNIPGFEVTKVKGPSVMAEGKKAKSSEVPKDEEGTTPDKPVKKKKS